MVEFSEVLIRNSLVCAVEILGQRKKSSISKPRMVALSNFIISCLYFLKAQEQKLSIFVEAASIDLKISSDISSQKD